jgi:hypothetical protein
MVEIAALLEAVPRVGAADPMMAIAMGERTLLLMRREGKATPLDVGSVHYNVFQLAAAIGDAEKAARHIALASESARLSLGATSSRAVHLAALAAAWASGCEWSNPADLIQKTDLNPLSSCSMRAAQSDKSSTA